MPIADSHLESMLGLDTRARSHGIVFGDLRDADRHRAIARDLPPCRVIIDDLSGSQYRAIPARRARRRCARETRRAAEIREQHRDRLAHRVGGGGASASTDSPRRCREARSGSSSAPQLGAPQRGAASAIKAGARPVRLTACPQSFRTYRAATANGKAYRRDQYSARSHGTSTMTSTACEAVGAHVEGGRENVSPIGPEPSRRRRRRTPAGRVGGDTLQHMPLTAPLKLPTGRRRPSTAVAGHGRGVHGGVGLGALQAAPGRERSVEQLAADLW